MALFWSVQFVSYKENKGEFVQTFRLEKGQWECQETARSWSCAVQYHPAAATTVAAPRRMVASTHSSFILT